MTVGSNLKSEHRVIRRLENVLRGMAAQIAEGKKPPAEDVEEAIKLMTEFVDSYHHVKEEVGLFPVIQGSAREQQKVVYGFLVEHEFGEGPRGGSNKNSTFGRRGKKGANRCPGFC